MSLAQPAPPTRQVTALLLAWQQGDRKAFSAMLSQVYDDLRRMALSRLRGADTPSLAAGDLLNEALVKLMESPPDWQNRAHFFASVSLAMRSVLVDHARARQADKRGGDWQRVTFTLGGHGEDGMVAELLTLDALLTQLQQRDPRAAGVLQLTYFAGLERDEIATVLGLSVATVDRELRFARAWLAQRLGRDELRG
jgi:RNA polymerase sigma factor (TIGR02999 family)